MSSNGSTGGHPFRVTFDQQRLADALAQELAGTELEVEAEDGRIVSIERAKTDQLVLRVLDAIRDTLAQQPSASARVQLNGREYVMRGEDHSSGANGSPARPPC